MRRSARGRGRGRDPLGVERGRHCSHCLEDRHRIQGAEQGHIQHVESKGPDAGMDVESDKGRDLAVIGYQGPAWLRFCVHITRPKTKGLLSLRSLHPEGPRVRSAYTEE